MAHLIFDLDGTIINTSKLKPYMRTSEGREYISQKDKIKWFDANNMLEVLLEPKFINELIPDHKISVLVSSPYWEESDITLARYGKNLLSFYGFSSSIDVYSANKPFSKLNKIIKSSGIEKENTIIIGDDCIDIMMAHSSKIPSIGVTWGDCEQERLKKSEPTLVVEDIEGLSSALEDFFSFRISYEGRKYPNRFSFLPENAYSFNSIIKGDKIIYLSYYVPYDILKKENEYESSIQGYETRAILDFKYAKMFSREEINKGKRDKFFSKGEIINSRPFRDCLKEFIDKSIEALEKRLKGRYIILATPNALPSFCYRTDINRKFIESLKGLQKKGVQIWS